jgi:hypothetical protein
LRWHPRAPPGRSIAPNPYVLISQVAQGREYLFRWHSGLCVGWSRISASGRFPGHDEGGVEGAKFCPTPLARPAGASRESVNVSRHLTASARSIAGACSPDDLGRSGRRSSSLARVGRRRLTSAFVAERLYQQLDHLMQLRKEARRELLTESQEHPARRARTQMALSMRMSTSPTRGRSPDSVTFTGGGAVAQ